MPPTANANPWRTGLIALLVLAMLTAAVPIRAQTIPGFADACPGELEATAHGNGTILLKINASSDVMLYRDSTAIAHVTGNAHTDAEVEAGITYTYHITLLVHGQETPPCDEATVTAKADASAQASPRNDTAQGNATGHGNATSGNATSGSTSGNATARVDAAAVLAACPATLRAEAKSDGSILLRVNASAAIDAVHVMRAEAGKNPVHVATLTASGTHLDTETETQVAYTYSIVIEVDGRTSAVCDALEVTSVPMFPGFTVVLATGIAGLAYVIARRSR